MILSLTSFMNLPGDKFLTPKRSQHKHAVEFAESGVQLILPEVCTVLTMLLMV
jgi:hypothetical protein